MAGEAFLPGKGEDETKGNARLATNTHAAMEAPMGMAAMVETVRRRPALRRKAAHSTLTRRTR